MLAVLHYLMEDEDPCMITLEEYINLEEQPFDVVLESGKFGIQSPICDASCVKSVCCKIKL